MAPAALNLQPGVTGGWGFSLLNDTSSYLVVTASDFSPTPLLDFGSYADLFQTRSDPLVLAPGASITEAYDGGAGIGAFTLTSGNLVVGQQRAGEIGLYYDLYDKNPFTDGTSTSVALDLRVSALASVQAVPEPSTWAMFAAGGLLALMRGRRGIRPSRSA